MAIAISVIGIAVAIMVGYLVIGQIQLAMPTGAAGSAAANVSLAANQAQVTIFAGFSLVAVGIIVMAAFGLIAIFK